MYNLLSLILGLAALILPVLAMGAAHDGSWKLPSFLSFLSFGCCLFAVCFQLCEVARRVDLMDWTALQDTRAVLVAPAAVLSAVVLLLNLMAWFRTLRNSRR